MTVLDCFPRFVRRAGTLALLALVAGCGTALRTPEHDAVRASVVRVPFPAAASADELRAEQLFVRGMTLALTGEPARAIEFFEEVLKIAPGSPAALAAMAEAHAGLNDPTTALFYAKQALDGAPENPSYYGLAAELHLATGDLPGAAAVFERQIQRFPDELDALQQLARVYALSGHLQEALALYERMLVLTGEDLQLRFQMLQIHTLLKDDEGARRMLEKMVSLDPDNPEIQRMLGESYIEQERIEEAIGLFEEMTRRNPNDVEATMKLAELYRQRGDLDRAGALLESSMQIEGLNAGELLARATQLYMRSDVDSSAARTAGRMLVRLLELEPDHEEGLFMLGDLKLRGGEHREAAELLVRALDRNPRSQEAWQNAVAAFLQAGDPKRAVEVSEEALILFPGQFPLLRLAGFAAMEAYENRLALSRFAEALDRLQEVAPDEADTRADVLSAMGMLYARVEAFEESDSAYAEAVRLNPSDAISLNNFAYSLAERRMRLPDALRMAERAAALEPANPSFLDTVGWIYFQMGQLDRANEWLSRSVSTGTASAAVHEHLGDVRHSLGRHAEAVELWRKALEMNPSSPGLREKIAGGGR